MKSNRLAMMWGIPFGVGLALFAADLVHHVIGREVGTPRSGCCRRSG